MNRRLSKQTRTLTCDFEVKALQDGEVAGTFEGYASTTGKLDHNGDIIAEGAFDSTLAEIQATSRVIPLLKYHDKTNIIGAIRTLVADHKGLRVKGELFLDIKDARDEYVRMQKKMLKLSIGFLLKSDDYTEDFNTGVWTINTLNLREISTTGFPADDDAEILSVKSEDVTTVRDLERCLHTDAGLSRSVAKTIASKFTEKVSQRDADLSKPDETQAVNEELGSLLEKMKKLTL